MKLKLGILALGSVNEKHGAALPADTDLRLAKYIAEKICEKLRAIFIGVIASSCEYPEIETGDHQTIETVLKDIEKVLRKAKNIHQIDTVVIVNGHGGNNLLKPLFPKLEEKLNLKLVFCNSLLNLEGPHAWIGETSVCLWLGIADESKLKEHVNFVRFPEVGFVGLKEARKKHAWIDEMASSVEKEDFRVSKLLGKVIIECTIRDILQTIEKLERKNE